MRRRFTTLDVFTAQRFSGNPLAVVRDGQSLDTAAMQAIAREFNLPETVFLQSPDATGQRARLRIFTPANELPFAGHPTVGTAVLLGLDGEEAIQEMVLGEGIGPVRCRFEKRTEHTGFALFEVPELPERLSDAGDAVAIAAALSVSLDDLGCDGFEPGRWSAGIPFAMIPLRGLDAVGRSRPNLSCWENAFGATGPRAAFTYCRETVTTGHAYHARMFAPYMGIPEDPATGSAAAAFAGVIARHGGLPDGEHNLTLEQGFEMGRPSLIHLTLTLAEGALVTASIGGDAVRVSDGVIEA
jgi:trans-2,3-dihydro-3-hydroxyanthranilate isomerase